MKTSDNFSDLISLGRQGHKDLNQFLRDIISGYQREGAHDKSKLSPDSVYAEMQRPLSSASHKARYHCPHFEASAVLELNSDDFFRYQRPKMPIRTLVSPDGQRAIADYFEAHANDVAPEKRTQTAALNKEQRTAALIREFRQRFSGKTPALSVAKLLLILEQPVSYKERLLESVRLTQKKWENIAASDPLPFEFEGMTLNARDFLLRSERPSTPSFVGGVSCDMIVKKLLGHDDPLITKKLLAPLLSQAVMATNRASYPQL